VIDVSDGILFIIQHYSVYRLLHTYIIGVECSHYLLCFDVHNVLIVIGTNVVVFLQSSDRKSLVLISNRNEREVSVVFKILAS